jgi:serine phosphatase RsbU (regulator of sigma subunit)
MKSATAGHPEPLLVDPEGSLVPGTIGLLVGVRRGADYVEAVHPLPATGTLFFYTDGLIERRGEMLTEGLERLARRAHPNESLERALDCILDEAIPHGSVDDTALLGVRWNT